MRLVNAEFLKLYKRTGLVLLSFAITVAPALIMFAATEEGHGGTRAFADQLGLVSALTIVAAVLIGSTLGTADLASGVFRELVVTGRSRRSLYAARMPAGLVLVLAVGAAGFAVVLVSALASAGPPVEPGFVPRGPGKLPGPAELSSYAPSAALVAKSGAWLVLVAVTGFALAFGVASFVGSPSASIATLLGLWLVVIPLIQNVDSLDWLRKVMVLEGLDRVMPAGLTVGVKELSISIGAAIAVLLAWSVVPLAAGAWRTVTRDC